MTSSVESHRIGRMSTPGGPEVQALDGWPGAANCESSAPEPVLERGVVCVIRNIRVIRVDQSCPRGGGVCECIDLTHWLERRVIATQQLDGTQIIACQRVSAS